ncbi:MAG: hypothetical protein MJ154_01825 [Candidatus Saccharibacteria bacterium]|nr:hypothetical protein [Candidatus Saccharibacteria bacterium]
MYSTAEGVLFEDGCANKNDQNGKDKNAEAAEERISKKRGSTVSEMNGNSEDGDGSSEEDGLEISEEQLKQLQDNAMSGSDVLQEIREESNRRSGGTFGGGAFGEHLVHW